MGEVGRWDADLFASFRAAPEGSPLRRRLLGELIRVNEPLIKVLVAQLAGRTTAAKVAGRVRNSMRVPGAEDVDWEEALNAGRFAFTKAIEKFDPAQGKIAGFLKWKIFYELQCAVVGNSVVRVKRGERAPRVEYIEDEEHLGRLVSSGDYDEPEFDEPARDLPQARTYEPPPPVVRELPRAPAVDRRPALDVLLEDHCAWSPSARTPASSVRGRYASLASQRGEAIVRGALVRALAEHGVRSLTVRAPWSSERVEGFAGLSLRSCGKESGGASRAA